MHCKGFQDIPVSRCEKIVFECFCQTELSCRCSYCARLSCEIPQVSLAIESDSASSTCSADGSLGGKLLYVFCRLLVDSALPLLVWRLTSLPSFHQEQIESHVDLGYLTSKKPLIFWFGEGAKMTVDEAWNLIRDKAYDPVMFIDRGGTSHLPPPTFLAEFQIVMTSNRRFINEWKNGSFREEIRRENMDLPGFSDSSAEVCSLLKVYWHRMVIDEGHSMAKDRENSTIQFASWISSERRWAMTGTPTKQNQNANSINQVKALVRFLRHGFFTPRCEGDLFWKDAVAQYWKGGFVAAFFRLRSLLQLIMKRHTKEDIAELPAPSFRDQIVPMSHVEVNTYNTLVAGVQSNILITSIKGKTSGKQDSLLHRNNSRHAREALENIRRVCVGCSRVIPTLIEKSWDETIDLSKGHGLDVVSIQRFLVRAVNEGLSECSSCSMLLSTLLIMPCCGKLICSECMDNKSVHCVLCEQEFDVDDFQLLQPGFVMEWKSNLDNPRGTKMDPSASSVRNGESAAHHLLLPGGVEGAVNRELNPDEFRVTRRQTRKFGDGHVCEYKYEYEYYGDKKCTLCREEHSPCNLLNPQRRCKTCGREADECPEEESKSFYLVNRFQELHAARRPGGTSQGHSRPLKIIVFSQFRQALNVVGDRLLRRFGTACVAEYWGKFRRQELSKFSHGTDCFCLLLSKDGSEGLDLSFVTHIFFLEEIWDQALKDQAVARAWRMGAKGGVEVDTLIAQNSVEETMRGFDKLAHEETTSEVDVPRNGSINQVELQRSKTKHLLLSLRFITDYHAFAKHGDEVRVEPEVKEDGKVKEEPKVKADSIVKEEGKMKEKSEVNDAPTVEEESIVKEEAKVIERPTKKRSLPIIECTSQGKLPASPRRKILKKVSFQLPKSKSGAR
jgi:hypothetical protein